MIKHVIEGKALWAKVHDPDSKFDPNGIYSISVLVEEDKAQEMCEYLNDLAKKKMAEEIKANPKRKNIAVKQPFEYATDRDGNDTSEIEFKFKLKAKFQSRDGKTFTQKPVVVDSKRTPMSKDKLIGNGSLVKVAFDPFPYLMMTTQQCSVSLRLKGVQVLNLVEYQGAGDLFDEEDGYIAKASQDTAGNEVNIEADF